MSFAEAKELAWMLFFTMLLTPFVVYGIGYTFAKITYKLTHRNTHKVHRSVQNKTEIVFDIGDTNKMNLFEIKQAKEKLEKSLKGAF